MPVSITKSYNSHSFINPCLICWFSQSKALIKIFSCRSSCPSGIWSKYNNPTHLYQIPSALIPSNPGFMVITLNTNLASKRCTRKGPLFFMLWDCFKENVGNNGTFNRGSMLYKLRSSLYYFTDGLIIAFQRNFTFCPVFDYTNKRVFYAFKATSLYKETISA